jgi:signal transduction histidine kinase
LDVHVERRLPRRVEVAAYYVVSEALSNAAKHAHASVVNVGLGTDDVTLRLAIRDDGIGGADPAGGPDWSGYTTASQHSAAPCGSPAPPATAPRD